MLSRNCALQQTCRKQETGGGRQQRSGLRRPVLVAMRRLVPLHAAHHLCPHSRHFAGIGRVVALMHGRMCSADLTSECRVSPIGPSKWVRDPALPMVPRYHTHHDLSFGGAS